MNGLAKDWTGARAAAPIEDELKDIQNKLKNGETIEGLSDPTVEPIVKGAEVDVSEADFDRLV